jgi:hypothetical protein
MAQEMSILDLGKSLLHKAENAGTAINQGIANTLGLSGSIDNLAEFSLPAGNDGPAVKRVTEQMQSTVNGLGTVSTLANGNDASIAQALSLIQTSSSAWRSRDGKTYVEKVDSLSNNEQAHALDSYLSMYDQQKGNIKPVSATEVAPAPVTTSGTLDLSGNIYSLKQAAVERANKIAQQAGSEGSIEASSYTNKAGESVNLTKAAGEIHYTATQAGQVVTDATWTKDKQSINYKGEKAAIDQLTHTLTYAGGGVSLTQKDGHAEIREQSGLQISTDGSNSTVTDSVGQLIAKVEAPGQVALEHHVTMFRSASTMASAVEQAKAAANTDGQTHILVAADGSTLAVRPDGNQVELRAKDHTAVIKTRDGRVLIVQQDGSVLILKDGQFQPLTSENKPADTAVNQGHVKVEGLDVGGGIIKDDNEHLKVDVKSVQVVAQDADKGLTHIDLSQPSQVKITQDNYTYTGNELGFIATNNQTGQVVSQYNWQTQTLETPATIIAPGHIHIKETNTDILADNTVKFDGGKGPVLCGNGAMQLDERTAIDVHGTLSSSPVSQAREGGSESIAQRAAATSTAADASADNVYNKALGGIVFMSDIGELNDAIGNVTGLINEAMLAGCPQLASLLESSYGRLVEALNFALPKAVAAEKAQAMGVSSPFLLKQVEDSTGGRSPEQAAEYVLKAA